MKKYPIKAVSGSVFEDVRELVVNSASIGENGQINLESLVPSNNLSDVASAPKALGNLMTHTATATAAGTTVLTATSTYYQEFTGSTTQTITLPVVTTLTKGRSFYIINNSTGTLTVNSSGANLVQSILTGSKAIITCIVITGTGASSWESTYISGENAYVDGVTSAIQTQLNAITAPSGAGTAAGTGNAATEASMATAHKTTLTLTNVAVTMADEAGVAAWGGLKIYDFPAGVIDVSAVANLTVSSTSTQVETATVVAAAGCTGDGNLIVTITGDGLAGSPLDVTVPLTTAANSASLVATEIRTVLNATGAVTAHCTIGGATDAITGTKALTAAGPDATFNIDINADHASTTATGITNATTSTDTTTGIIAAYDGDFALGTAIAANDASLTSTEADIIASTAMPQAVAGATTAKGFTASAPVRLDGTGTAKDLYLNFLIDDADQDIDLTAATLVANGTIVLHWANLGDY